MNAMKSSNASFISEASASAQGMAYHSCSICFASASYSISGRSIPMSSCAHIFTLRRQYTLWALEWRKEAESLWAEPQCSKTRESPSDRPAQGSMSTMTHNSICPLPDATLPGLQGAQVCSQLSQALLHGDRAGLGRQSEFRQFALILRLSVFCSISGPRLFLRLFLWVFRFVWTFITKIFATYYGSVYLPWWSLYC